MNQKKDNLSTIGIFVYFALLALGVPYAQHNRYGMEGILAVMAGSAVFLLLIYGIVKLTREEIQDWLRRRGTSPREFRGYLAHGHQTDQLALVPTGTRSLALTNQLDGELGAMVRQALADDDEEGDELGEEEGGEEAWDWQTGEVRTRLQQLPAPRVRGLLEDGGLDLAPNFKPHPKSITCQNITFIGVRRSGKSNAEAILLKQLAKRGFPLIVFDTEGEYDELARKQHMPRGVLVGSAESQSDAPEGIRFYAIDQANAYNFAQIALEECLQVVVNLNAWSDDEAAMIISEMITGMEDWQQHRTQEQRIPFYVALTEITKWVPQNLGESTLSKEATKAVQHALFDVAVRRGGKRGFGLITDAQNFAALDKRVLAGMWKIIFNETERNDIERLGDAPLHLNAQEISSLAVGESYVFCPQAPHGIFVKWPLSDVPLGGSSPSLDNLRTHHRHLKTSVTGVLDRLETKSIQAMLERTSAQRSVVQRQVEQDERPAQESDLERALKAYDEGNTTIDALAVALGISSWNARPIYQQVKQLRKG